MSHLFSGFNQKQQSGKITNGTFVIGSTKGRGSTSRMFNYCTQTSSTPYLCINQFITKTPTTTETPTRQTTVESDILIDVSSFDKLFDYDNSGEPKPIPEIYKICFNKCCK